MNDRQQRVDDFVKAFHRESALIADYLGLDLSPAEMRQVKERLVFLWVVQKLTDQYMQRLFETVTSQPGFGDYDDLFTRQEYYDY